MSILRVRQPLAAVSRDKGLLDVVVVSTDSHIYHKSYDGSSWSEDWVEIGSGDELFEDEAPALVASTTERLDVFGRLRSSKRLVHARWTYGVWSTEWDSPADDEEPEFERRFVAVSSRVGQIDLFGTTEDQFYYRSIVNGSWSAWEHWSGPFQSNLTATCWSIGHIDVLGICEDSQMWHDTYDSAAGGWPLDRNEWTTNFSAPGALKSFASDPAMVSWPSDQLHLFVIVASDSSEGKHYGLYYQMHSEGDWTDWKNLGGNLSSAASAVASGQGRLHVAVRGGDHAVWHRWFEDGDWTGWDSLGGGPFGTAPVVVSRGSNELDVFAMSRGNGLIMHASYDGSRWTAWSPLQRLPGQSTATTTTSMNIWASPSSTKSDQASPVSGTASSTSATSSASDTDASHLETGAIVGIVVGAAVALFAVAAALFWYRRKARNKRINAASSSEVKEYRVQACQEVDNTEQRKVHELQEDHVLHMPMSNPIANTSGPHELDINRL